MAVKVIPGIYFLLLKTPKFTVVVSRRKCEPFAYRYLSTFLIPL